MDTQVFDSLSRVVYASASRRVALLGLLAGSAVGASGGSVFQTRDAAARKKKRKSKKKRKMDTQDQPPPIQQNVCEAKNWCVDRTQTCGPAGGSGKCLVESTGGNLCAEILFQANSCADCAAPTCTNCRCVLAAGGGDRCNNGAQGFDFICVRPL